MSKTVSSAWIETYLLDIAIENGASSTAFTIPGKRKKVQVIRILHYGSNNPEEDSIIWAEISDKKHSIPVRFSQECVAQYRILHGQRFTQHKTRLIVLEEYRLMHTRIPIAGEERLSAQPKLAFDCTAFSLVGSEGEGIWGEPKNVEISVKDLSEWSDGLKRGGGGGNILKNRKLEQDKKHATILLPPGHGSPRSLQEKPGETSKLPGQKPAEAIPSRATRKQPSSKGKEKAKDEEVLQSSETTSREVRDTIVNNADTSKRKRRRQWVGCSRCPEKARPEGWEDTLRGLHIDDDNRTEERTCSDNVLPGPEETETAVEATKKSAPKSRKKRSNPLDLDTPQPSQILAGHEDKAPLDTAASQTQQDDGIGSWPSQQATPPPSDRDQQRDRSSSPLSWWSQTDNEAEDAEEEDEEQEQDLAPFLHLSSSPTSSSTRHSSPVRWGFSLSAPTPAQRKRVALVSSQTPNLSHEDPHSLSLPIPSSSPDIPTTSSQMRRAEVPSSSLSSFRLGQGVRRKVPPPRRPEEYNLPLGESPRILVPNSDTSGSQGQSQNSQVHKAAPLKEQVEEEEERSARTKGIDYPSDLIVPETQTQRSITRSITEQEDEEDVAPQAVANCSMDVHLGTIGDIYPEGDQKRGREPASIYQRPPQPIYRQPAEDGDPSQGHDADDEQTMESLFGGRRAYGIGRYDPAEWEKPGFMTLTRTRDPRHDSTSNQPRNAVAGSSTRPLEPSKSKSHRNRAVPDRDDGVLGSISKGKKRAREDEYGEQHIRKKSRVEHDAAVPEGGSTKMKLNGFSLDLSRESWMVTWERLGEILLRTGRERTKRLNDSADIQYGEAGKTNVSDI